MHKWKLKRRRCERQQNNCDVIERHQAKALKQEGKGV